MKIKEFRRAVAALFPATFAHLFEQCYTKQEVDILSAGLKIAVEEVSKQELRHAIAITKANVSLQFLEERVSKLEERVRAAGPPVATVRNGEPPQEEVILTQCVEVGEGPDKFKNKIGLIKAVREISNLPLKEAKDLVEDVIDHQRRRVVFKGPLDKAAVAVRVMGAAGGVCERKEAI